MSGPLERIEAWLDIGKKWGGGAAPIMEIHGLHDHEGLVFTSGYLVTGVADGAQINMLMWNPNGVNGKEMHASLSASLGGRGYGLLYEGVDVTTTGTVQKSVRLNRVREREGALDPAEWMVAGGAGINDLGVQVGERYIIGSEGTNPNAAIAAGTTSHEYEWILDPSSSYLLVVLNTSGATVPVQPIIEWIEEDQDADGR